MSLVVYLFLLSAALCCTAAPTDEGPKCKHPGKMANAVLDGDWDDASYPENTVAAYSCNPGYSRLGSIKKICKGGKWESLGTSGQCRKRSCGHPGDIPFGTFELIREEEFVFGAVVQYSCDDGYQMVSRQDKRECTASGWSNFPPHCEVRNCPPVAAVENVNVLSTSYDEEYSVGQVVRFECKNPRLKLNGPSEIFCTSEGNWNLDAPTCVEITCNKPSIENGKVNSDLKIYRENNPIQFECNRGFKARNSMAKCTKDGWSPTPACEEITCNPYQAVANGRLAIEQSVYREGEETDLQCDEYYTTQNESGPKLKCTSNGWDPPPLCMSIKCNRPEIKNGNIYYSYRFPLQTGRDMDYRCNDNYLSHARNYWGRSRCTNSGWNPEPKCVRTCYYLDAQIENGRISYKEYNYFEGEEISFTCYDGFKTANRKNSGKRICLSNGKFSPAKCSKTCSINSHQNGKYEPNKVEFDIGEYVQYECDVGFKSPNGNLKDSSQCLSDGWSVTPKCTPITCKWKDKNYSNGERTEYTCPNGERQSISPLIQCFYYGWGPPPDCEAITCTIPEELNVIRRPLKTSYKYNQAVAFSCGRDFNIVGSKRSECTVNGWNPPLPDCKAKNISPTTLSPDKTESSLVPSTPSPDKSAENLFPSTLSPDKTESSLVPSTPSPDKSETRLECAPAYSPKNAEIISPREKYYTDDEVQFKCGIGYKLYGSASVKCNNDGVWESSPQCIELKKCKVPSNIKNGRKTEDINQDYYTDSIVKYTCNPGFHITGSDRVTCIDGQWTALPECTGNSCGKALPINNGYVTEQNIDFQHGERANYQCNADFALSDGSSAECIKGEWNKIPTCVTTTCTSPPKGKNSIPRSTKSVYRSGDKVTYSCDIGFSLDQSKNDKAVCENAEWKDIPSCRKTGAHCGPPPVVQFGDTKDIRKAEYQSNDFVEFKCPDYYVLQGKSIITCRNGDWEEAPICLEPCTIKENDMKLNNVRLRYGDRNKLYSKHDDTTEFYCLPGYEALPKTEMRQKCNQGVVQYPKCFRSGYCVLQTSEMIRHNIHYNRSTIIENEETILFECVNGLTPEGNLQSTCKKGKINYQKCVASRSCRGPTISNGKLKTEPKESFDSGSYVEFVCDENFFLDGKINVRCENGQWLDLPQCLKPCKILTADLDKNNVVLKSTDHLNKIYKHGTEVDISCKAGFKRQNQASLKGVCYNGNMVYQRCFSGDICRLNQDDVDENKIELHEEHYNEMFYEVDEKIRFKCKEGFRNFSEMTAICLKNGILHYPSCKV